MKKLVLFLCLLATPAFAQSSWVTPGNQTVGGAVGMCLNTAGIAVPCNAGAGGAAGYPGGSTPVSAVSSGADTTSAAATLAAAASKFTYLCNFTVSGLGSTAGGPVTVAITGLTNTLSYTYVFAAAATTPNTPLQYTFSPCLPSSAVNTAIVVTVPGEAGNTATQINASGFQL